MAFSLSSGFGANKPTFNFGSTTATSTAGTGFGTFGATTTPVSTGFGFGTANTSAPTGFGAFGSTNTTAPTGFGGFGTNTGSSFGTLGAAPAATSSLFGAGGFGNTAAKPNTSFGTNTFGTTGFGTAGFGTGTFGSAAPTFGTNTGTVGTSLFGNTPAFGTGAGTSTFGTGSAFGAGAFGAFGTKPAGTAFGSFGTGLGATTAFGQQQPQQQQTQQGPASAHEALIAAVFNCQVFGDERDQVLAKWNLLQAQWGTGKAYYSSTAAPLELSEQNPLCRFKAVGYSRLGGRDDKDGIVSLLFQKKEEEVKSNQQQLINSLAGLLGSKPNLQINIESVKSVSENKTQVMMYVVDTGATGLLGSAPGSARVSATELANFLNTPSPKAALASAGCSTVSAVTRPSGQVLQAYLQTPPPGMDIRLWKQAQADNPDPENYIPVPIVGFSEIKWRTQCQSEETALHSGFLRQASDKLAALHKRRAASAAKLTQLSADLHRLQHTLLQVVCRQEMLARAGSALTPEEEALRARLHELTSQLAAPPLYNGRLNEMLSAVRLQRSASAGGSHERYHLDPGAQEDIKQFLMMQQKSMSHLMETAKADLAVLSKLAEGVARVAQGAT